VPPEPSDHAQADRTTALAIAPSGVRKSAILLRSLEPQQARQILSRLPADAVRAVQREMASLEQVQASERTEVVQQYRRALSRPLARQTGPPAHTVEAVVTPDPLHDCSPDAVYEALVDEHPQTIAAVLASFPVSRAGQCLSRMPIRTQIEAIRRLASLKSIDGKVLEAVHSIIRTRPRHPTAATSSEFTRASDSPRMEDLADTTGDLDFEALSRLDDNEMRHVLEEIDSDGLALAISTASRELRRRVLEALPKSTKAQVKRAARSRPLYLSDIESAQARILGIVKRLQAAGELSRAVPAPARKGD
jgi:flagellar motor switch protein FliG